MRSDLDKDERRDGKKTRERKRDRDTPDSSRVNGDLSGPVHPPLMLGSGVKFS